MDKLMPDAVTLVEVGPRDGFQLEKAVLPTDRKLAVIARLVAAGLKQIQVASFVHPQKVPQMADAGQLIGGLPRADGVVYSALVLNQRGLDRAMASGIEAVEISLSASDAHSRKNTGVAHSEALDQGLDMIDRAVVAGLHVRASVQCAFGCVHEGPISTAHIAAIIRRFVDHGTHELSLADTTGMGSPPVIQTALDAVLPLAGSLPLALHLHDTRGLGLVNLMGIDPWCIDFRHRPGRHGRMPFRSRGGRQYRHRRYRPPAGTPGHVNRSELPSCGRCFPRYGAVFP